MKTIKELMSLKGRVAIVTGGAGHIGFTAAEALAELGANIVLLDISKDECVKKAKIINETYCIEALPLAVDLSKEDEVKKVPDIVLERLGRIDILINCAALTGTSQLEDWAVSFKEQSSDSWRKALEVNLTSAFVLTKACKDALVSSGHGSVINIGSIYGIAGPNMKLYEGTNMGNPAGYAASKGGLIQFTRWLATVLAPAVRVNAISPGGIFREHKDPFLSRYVDHTPLKRMGREEDLKGAAAFLASDLSAYVTGHNLVVDGGWTAW